MAVDFFLKLDSIKGEATDSEHKDEISILSWSWGATQVTAVAMNSGAGGAGKANLSDLHIVKGYDAASVPLFKALLEGKTFKGVLTATKAGGAKKPFLKVSLEELFVTSIQTSGSSEIPTESVSFSYGKITTEYSKQNEDGNLVSAGSVTYDVKANTLS